MKNDLNNNILLKKQLFEDRVADNNEVIELTVKRVSSIEEFSELEPVWDELASISPGTIYQTFEWSFYWWKSYSNKDNYELFILLFYHDKRLVGIAPCFLSKEVFLGFSFVRRLNLLGSGTAFRKSFGLFLDNGVSDYLDVLILPKYESGVAVKFLTYLSEHHNLYDEVQLLNIREKSNIYKYILPITGNYGLHCNLTRADCCPYIKVPATMEEFMHELHDSSRRKLTQARKAAVEGSLFEICSIDSTEDSKQALADVIQLHQIRWNRLGYPGFFSDECYREFFTSVFWAFHSKGWLWFKVARSQSRCIAGRLAFYYKEQYYDYLSGFDDQVPAAKRRPGLALLLGMVKDACSNKVTIVDLLRGEEPYKFEFTADHFWNWNIVLTKSDYKKRKIRYYTKQIITLIKLIPYLILRETKLFELQRRRHRYLMAYVTYFRFRLPHFLHKVLKAIRRDNSQSEVKK
jgi:hypothetical protein